MSVNQYERLHELIRLLDERQAEPKNMHWFYNDANLGIEVDEAESYCWDCIHALYPDAKIGEHFGGGNVPSEEDDRASCERCGVLLGYTLTDDGVASELESFVETGLDWSSADECYELACVAHGIFENDEQSLKLLKVLEEGMNKPV